MLIEARLTWDGDLLAVAHLPAKGTVRAGDFGLAIPGDPREVIASGGGLVRRRITADAVTATFSLTESARVPRFALGDFRTSKGVGLATVLHATILAMAFIGRATPAELADGQLETMKRLSSAIDSREGGQLTEDPQSVPQSDSSTAKTGEPGIAGSPMAQKPAGLASRSKGAENPEVKREAEVAEAREFGMIGLLLPSDTARPGGSDPFGSYEGPSAIGSIFGTQVDDAFGFGGSALSGTGIGGGGKGAGIERDGVGLGWGMGCGCGHGVAYGSGSVGKGGGRAGHVVKSPVLRCAIDETTTVEACATQVNGRLPPEVVQRVVRQNFGRMRACYEAGLVRNPSLEGRIAVKFVIDRSGAVAMVSTADRSIADSDVAACIGRAFQSMSFPEPEGGIVTVVYPLSLST